MAGTLTIGGLAEGLLSGEKTIGPLTMSGSAAVGGILDVTLAAGDNTLSVPAGAVAFVLVLASTNSATLKLRSNLNSGDAGLPFGPTGWMAAPLATGVTSLIVNASAGGAAVEATFI